MTSTTPEVRKRKRPTANYTWNDTIRELEAKPAPLPGESLKRYELLLHNPRGDADGNYYVREMRHAQMIETDDGTYVLYSDHEAAVCATSAALVEECDRLRTAYNKLEDRARDDNWILTEELARVKAKIAEYEAEIEEVKNLSRLCAAATIKSMDAADEAADAEARLWEALDG